MNDKVILYTTGCPRCKVLKDRLDGLKITYETITDVDVMTKLGISSVPVLSVNDKLMAFPEALKWVQNHCEVEGVFECDSCNI